MAAVTATKGNLLAAKNSLELAKNGYELLDKKRVILINEMMRLIDVAGEIQSHIDDTFCRAYAALQNANITEGISEVDKIASSVSVDDSVSVRFRSVMGVEIPEVSFEEKTVEPMFGFLGVSMAIDEACQQFENVRRLTLRLAETETAIYRLAINIRKTQKRANALKNIIIPRYTGMIKEITVALDEKEREEFSRLKVIKHKKM